MAYGDFASDRMALDRGSVRSYDKDERLHVELTNISKANVCPYLGHEIPNWQALGLQPDQVYQLLRDPEELARAASTFNNLPLLNKHVPVTARDHKPELVVGSTGTDASFVAPYLRNSLVVWASDEIALIESGKQRELSSAYYYRADMTPGVFAGVRYHGVMRDIVGNHVCLVEDGRAGDDVVVGDSAHLVRGLVNKETSMTKPVLTRKAALLQGAIFAHLRPRLAQDASIDFGPILKGVGPKNYKSRKASIAAAITKACQGKLAQDATLDQVVELLDTLDDVMPMEELDEEHLLNAGAPINAQDDEDDSSPAAVTDPMDAVMNFLQDKLSSEDLGQIKSMLAPPAAADEETEEECEARKKREQAEAATATAAQDEEEDCNKMVSKGAMDAAIAKASGAATANALAQAKAIREAETAVRPYVGELVAMDSAEQVYRSALRTMGVDTKGIHHSALPAILKMQPVPGARRETPQPLAMDAARIASFAERFPDAARVGSI